MRIPQSDIEVSFEADCVIVRDKTSSKIVSISGMTFEDILTEVQTFAYFRNCRPARRLLRFLLLRAGIPNQEEFPRTDILNHEDIQKLAEALGSVDDLTDSFFSSHSGGQPIFDTPEPEKDHEKSHSHKLEVSQSKRASIWTSDAKIEIVYSFTPENIPEAIPESTV